jgi:hypothetical protein
MTTIKDEIVGRLDADQAAWHDLVARVPVSRMAEPGPMGEWSFRDLVSHLLAWRNRTIGRLEAAAAGAARPPAPWPAGMDEDEPINAWFRDQDAGRSADDLLGAYEASFPRLRDAVGALPAAAFVAETETPGYYRWRDSAGELQSDFSGHLQDHAADVEAWLARG